MTDGSGIDHREYNKSNEEADRLGKEAWSMCRLLFLEELTPRPDTQAQWERRRGHRQETPCAARRAVRNP